MEANEAYSHLIFPCDTVVPDAEFDADFSSHLTPGRTSSVLIICVWLWSMIETPLELSVEMEKDQVTAIIAAKIVFSVVAWLALRRSYVGLVVFTFACTTSVLAIAFTLPIEYGSWRIAFYFSLAECVMKLAVIVALSIRYLYDR